MPSNLIGATVESAIETVCRPLLPPPVRANRTALPSGVQVITDEGAPGGEHDDGHIHLTHCCGHQAAVPARVQVHAHAPRNASPLERARIAFAPAPRTAPFRPPIAA